MQLKRAGTLPSQKGPAEYFTGVVRIDPLNAPPLPSRVACAAVTFEPGARTAWHTHPLGQTLIVTAGCGWAQCKGEAIVEIHPRWRRGLVPAWPQALARSHPNHGYDPYRRAGSARRKKRRVDGEGDRRGLSRGSGAAVSAPGRMGGADEVAALALWLCSPGASFVLGALPVTGASWRTDAAQPIVAAHRRLTLITGRLHKTGALHDRRTH